MQNDYQAIIEQIKKKIDIEKLKELLFKTSVIAWDYKMPEKTVDKWLENFDGSVIGDVEAEKKIALWILLHFVFYTDSDVRHLCKTIYDEYIHHKLIEYKENNTLKHLSVTEKIMHILHDTLFVALGNDSESGANILYFFRQENKLSKESFEIDSEKEFENLVFIDDVTISGDQASKYIKSYNIKRKNTYLLTFIATTDAISYFTKTGNDIKLINSIFLDERAKCFSDMSYVFSESNTRQFISIAKQMSQAYGTLIMKGHAYMEKHPLGFSDGQYLFGFYYNTPDNSLPIIWCDINNWKPAFKRYNKMYSQLEVNINESIYV